MSYRGLFARVGVLTALAAGATMLGTGIASAHVTANIYGTQPTKGGYGAIVFRVPNEEPDAGTVKLEVAIDPNYGISSLRTKPVPGWTAEVSKAKLPAPIKNGSGQDVSEVVTKVAWTAQPGTKIAAGSTEFQEFEISAGPLPSAMDSISLPAAQTYDDGAVVNWNQATVAGGEEPEHPAPVVQLAAKTSDEHSGMAGHGPENAEPSAHTNSTDNTARWLGGGGLVVGALAFGFAAGATLRVRRSNRASSAASTEATVEGTKETP